MTTHFLHIGKTGGSAIKSALRPIAAECNLKLHKHLVRLSDIPFGEHVFFTLRDPISRFVSGFYSRQRKGQPRFYNEWSDGERRAFELYPTANSLAEDLGSKEAANAMASIGHVKTHVSRRWFQGLDELNRRQSDICLILFQETLSEDFEALKRRLNLPPHLSLPESMKAAHRAPEDIDRNLSSRAIDNLRSWYAEDIALVERLRAQRNERAAFLQKL